MTEKNTLLSFNTFRNADFMTYEEQQRFIEKYKNLKLTDEQILNHPILSLYVFVHNNELYLNKQKIHNHPGLHKVFSRHTDLCMKCNPSIIYTGKPLKNVLF